MTVKRSKNAPGSTQFRCKNKFGEGAQMQARIREPGGSQTWEDDFIASAGCTMAMTFEEFYEVYEATMFGRRLRELTHGATRTTWSGRRSCRTSRTAA